MTTHEEITDPTELEWRLIYSMIVAGKSATFANAVTRRLIARIANPPLLTIAEMARCELEEHLRAARTGNYTKLVEGLTELATLVDAGLNLRTCSPDDLQQIHGVGPKTARFFILWTRPSERYAALDVHVLRWLRRKGHKAPRSTPSSEKEYARLEQVFLAEADERNMTARELDHQIWLAGATGPNTIER